MRHLSILIVALFPTFACAQTESVIQRSSSPRGVEIQGDTAINASVQNTTTSAQGENNTAKTAAGVIKSGVNIKGDTKINVTVRESNAIATGKGNQAGNAAGAIGGSN